LDKGATYYLQPVAEVLSLEVVFLRLVQSLIIAELAGGWKGVVHIFEAKRQDSQ
jgi:hypothetical protein